LLVRLDPITLSKTVKGEERRVKGKTGTALTPIRSAIKTHKKLYFFQITFLERVSKPGQGTTNTVSCRASQPAHQFV
jgi:hypothetical protein